MEKIYFPLGHKKRPFFTWSFRLAIIPLFNFQVKKNAGIKPVVLANYIVCFG